ncbi:hypothetical protein MNEG_10006 [Monoraphidium neglectum]|uniref:Tr-type G domain-containing protein n=1 Tax=Monoraphidium neglectum TaxID=145388 RepID=A0A0D2JEF3_9CHLO|nr:hypothetical protein MNEG_10006 [Monoraphidium neglectum]KIY97957.1 hypothetical protein MNEG_10006 [Monoraphidium neglectum]|eukprot:XP_013896977.1 hypothetical protein MNEG_10006 [Monoraphidium neglectum]
MASFTASRVQASGVARDSSLVAARSAPVAPVARGSIAAPANVLLAANAQAVQNGVPARQARSQPKRGVVCAAGKDAAVAEREVTLDRYRNIGIMAHIDAGKVGPCKPGRAWGGLRTGSPRRPWRPAGACDTGVHCWI